MAAHGKGVAVNVLAVYLPVYKVVSAGVGQDDVLVLDSIIRGGRAVGHGNMVCLDGADLHIIAGHDKGGFAAVLVGIKAHALGLGIPACEMHVLGVRVGLNGHRFALFGFGHGGAAHTGCTAVYRNGRGDAVTGHESHIWGQCIHIHRGAVVAGGVARIGGIFVPAVDLAIGSAVGLPHVCGVQQGGAAHPRAEVNVCALCFGGVVADRAAGKGECMIIVDTAAVIGCAAGNAAAGHGHAVIDIHAAAH